MFEGPDKARFVRLEQLFQMAVGTPVDLRAALLQRECGGDVELREELEGLLRTDAATRDLAALALAGQPADLPDAPAIPGYRLGRRIGAGGMGHVFEAEQLEPPRRVAVKLLRRLDAGARERLRQEAALLARLQHPNVASIFASDTHGEAPFLVMELVDGERLDAWLAQCRPARAQRLDVLLQICRAVQHAHQQGVVHRDLKPANVMVDREGLVKVLDFGIAAATADPATEPAAGTLGYISPEQLRSGRASHDTRVDVYAIGVIAYEMLAGAAPFRMAGGTALQVADLAERGPRNLGEVDPTLRGDLQAIVAQAMAPNPERRYGAVALLAADLERFLRCEPVSVRAPRMAYVAWRFAQRHRGVVMAAALAVFALVGGLVASLVLLARTRHAEAAERTARASAQTEAEVTREYAGLIESMLAAPNYHRGDVPEGTRARDIKVVDVLDEFARDLDGRKLPPAAELAVRQVLGSTYLSVDAVASGVAQLTRAAELPAAAALDGFGRQVRVLGALAMGLGRQGQHDAAVRTAERAVQLAQTSGLAADVIAGVQALLARALERAGRRRETVNVLPADLTGSGVGTIKARVAVARSLRSQGEAAASLDRLAAMSGELATASLELRIDHAVARAEALLDLRRTAEAVAELREVLAAADARLGPEHSRALEVGNRLGIALVADGDYAAARELLTAALAAARAANAPASRGKAFVLRTLATVALHEYEPAAAAAYEAESWVTLAATGAGDAASDVRRSRLDAARYAWLAGDVPTARADLERLATELAPDDGFGRDVSRLLGVVLADAGEVNAALAAFEHVRDAAPDDARALAEMRMALRAAGRQELAAQYARGRRSQGRPDFPPVAALTLQRYLDRGHAELVEEALTRRLATADSAHAPYGHLLHGRALADLGRTDEAKRAVVEAQRLAVASGRQPCAAFTRLLSALRARPGVGD